MIQSREFIILPSLRYFLSNTSVSLWKRVLQEKSGNCSNSLSFQINFPFDQLVFWLRGRQIKNSWGTKAWQLWFFLAGSTTYHIGSQRGPWNSQVLYQVLVHWASQTTLGGRCYYPALPMRTLDHMALSNASCLLLFASYIPMVQRMSVKGDWILILFFFSVV